MKKPTAQYREVGEGTVRHYFDELATGFTPKLVLSIIGTIVAHLEGFYGKLIWPFLALVLLDLVSGIFKAWKKGQRISSKGLRNTVTKLGGYMTLITAFLVASQYIDVLSSVVSIIYYFCIFTELRSIVENAEEVVDSTLIKFLKNVISSMLKQSTGIDTEEEEKDANKTDNH